MNEVTASASPAAPHLWWRHNRGWLLGAVLLAALAFYLPIRDAYWEYQRFRPHLPVDLARSAWGKYAGASWRLVDASLKTATGPGSKFDLDRLDAAVLVLRYEVLLAPGTDPDKLDTCRGRLLAEDGREWESQDGSPFRRAARPLSTSCTRRYGADFKQKLAVPGQPFTFVQFYVVPRSIDWRRLHARIDVLNPEQAPVEQRTRYLRFSLQ